jgi:PiT family inorganic phosphate transporter
VRAGPGAAPAGRRARAASDMVDSLRRGLAAGLAYAGYNLVADMRQAGQPPLAVGAFALLGLAGRASGEGGVGHGGLAPAGLPVKE